MWDPPETVGPANRVRANGQGLVFTSTCDAEAGAVPAGAAEAALLLACIV